MLKIYYPSEDLIQNIIKTLTGKVDFCINFENDTYIEISEYPLLITHTGHTFRVAYDRDCKLYFDEKDFNRLVLE